MTRARPQVIVYGLTAGFSAAVLLRGQLSWMKAQGWDVLLVSGQGADEFARREGVGFHLIEMSREPSPLKDLVSFIRWIALLVRARPQAVNVGTPKAGLLGMVAAWITRVPRRVYVQRGLRLETTIGLMASILKAFERLACHLATDVVFVSRSLAVEAQRRGIVSPGRSMLIGLGSSNGVDCEAVQKAIRTVDAPLLRATLGIPPSATVVGFVGRLTEDKGLNALLSLARSDNLDKAVLVLLVGRVEGVDIASELTEIGGRIRVVGWVQDPWSYLPVMDILCLPTLREGFPNVVLEAGAAALPTVTTRATGAVDSVVDGETGFLVSTLDSHGLVDRINALAKDPDLRQRMGAAAQKRVAAEFRPERIWSGLLSIIEGRPNADVHRV